MPPSSLAKMASRACIKNIRSITDVGDAPYPVVRSILLRVSNPEQLRQIELASPQICGQDSELWLEFIKRDVPNWDKKPYEPEDPKKWYRAYKKLLLNSQKEVEDDVAGLKATLDKIKKDQASHKAQRVELKGVPVPEGMKSHGPVIALATMPKFHDRVTYHKSDERFVKKDRFLEEDDNLEREGEARAFVSSKSKLDKFRKEAKAMSHFQKSTRPGIFAPIDKRSKPTTTRAMVLTAPRTLIEDHRKAAIPTAFDPSIKPAEVFAPKRKREEREEPRPNVMTSEEREKRLKAFTNPSSAKNSIPTQATPTSISPLSKPATSSPCKATVPPPPAVKLATPPLPKKEATSSTFSSPPKGKDRASPVLVPGVPRAKTCSPMNGTTRPAGMQMKKKAPVDIFMPAKRRKIS